MAASRPGMSFRLCVAGGVAAVLAFLSPVIARAQNAVDLQLILAVDASASVDTTRFELQRKGYVAAFRNKQVLEALRGGGHQSIAVAMFSRATGRPAALRRASASAGKLPRWPLASR